MRIEKKMAEIGLEVPAIEVHTDVPLIPGVKVEDRFGLEHADGAMAVPGVTSASGGPAT